MESDRRRAGFDVTYVGFLLGHGGDALQMLDLAEGMQRGGARVRIIVPATPESVVFAERAQHVGVECERTRLIDVSMSGTRQSLRAMLRLFRSIDSPIVHLHTGNSCLPRVAMIALTLLRYRRAIATLQSPYETIEPGSGRARFWAATANRRLAAVVSPSRHGTEFQVRCGVRAELTTTIPNCVDLERCSGGDGTGPRAELGLGPDDALVVFTSRVAGQKRPVDAVRVFAAVAAEFPTAHLVFVGNGDDVPVVVDEVRRLGLAPRVHLVGYRTDIADWLAAATVWILPTERENFSVAVLEALAAGCTVLATRCPGNDEVLVGGQNSLTFAVGDIDGGAAGLRALLGDPELRSRLASAGAADAQRFSADAMVDRYASVYGSMNATATQASPA